MKDLIYIHQRGCGQLGKIIINTTDNIHYEESINMLHACFLSLTMNKM
jgi:hypothetical protein